MKKAFAQGFAEGMDPNRPTLIGEEFFRPIPLNFEPVVVPPEDPYYLDDVEIEAELL